MDECVKKKSKGFGDADFIPEFVTLSNDRGAFNIVVELVRGSALSSLLRSEPLTPQELFRATDLVFLLRRLTLTKRASRDEAGRSLRIQE